MNRPVTTVRGEHSAHLPPTPVINGSADPCQAGAARHDAARIAKTKDLHDATREALAHAPDHRASDANEDGVGEEGGPCAGGRAGQCQQDAARDVQGVIPQGVGSEALGGHQVVGVRYRNFYIGWNYWITIQTVITQYIHCSALSYRRLLRKRKTLLSTKKNTPPKLL